MIKGCKPHTHRGATLDFKRAITTDASTHTTALLGDCPERAAACYDALIARPPSLFPHLGSLESPAAALCRALGITIRLLEALYATRRLIPDVPLSEGSKISGNRSPT